MKRIENTFNKLKIQGKKALITFVTAGDPNLEGTKQLVFEMIKRGADIVELGIPYSDPIAEGAVIQAANTRALKNDIKIRDVIKLVEEMRKDTEVPLVFLLYYNCIFQYGTERFLSDCEKAGLDGLIIPDLPFEEREEIDTISRNFKIDIITLVSPTSNHRMETIAKSATGFLYCVSSLGVTGIRSDFNTDFEAFFRQLNAVTDIPKALGFGISTPKQVRDLGKYCDGLIVGSAIVKRVGDSKTIQEALVNVGDYVESLRKAADEP